MKTLLLLPILTALSIGHAFACQCASMPIEQRTKVNDEVCVAKVLTHVPLHMLEFEVLEVLKGEPPRHVSVPTGQSDCDFFVKPVRGEPDEQFLIFASKGNNVRSISRCLGTAPLEDVKADLQYLRVQKSRGKPQ